MVTSKNFIGFEVEGKDNRGRRTLFIADKSTNLKQIKKILKNNKDITHIYFGAGENRGVVINQCESLFWLDKQNYTVTVEVGDVTQADQVPLLENITLVLAIKSPVSITPLIHRKVNIKIEDNKKMIVYDTEAYVTFKDNPMYKKDKEVEI